MPVCLRVWLHHLYARLLAYLSSNKHSPLSSLQAPVEKKKLNSVWLNLKDKVHRGGWHNRRKGPSIQFCPSCLFYLSKTARPVPPELGSFQFLWILGFAALVIRQATASKERASEAVRWMDSRSVPNAKCAATGGTSKSEDSNRRCYPIPSKPPSFKTKSQPPRYAHERPSTFKMTLRRLKKVAWIVSWQFNHLKMYVTLFCKMYVALFRGTMKHKSV